VKKTKKSFERSPDDILVLICQPRRKDNKARVFYDAQNGL